MENKWLRFESKFGWSEVIAGLALVVAAAAWHQSWSANRPIIRVTDFPVGIGPIQDEGDQQYVFVGLMPLVFSNDGGRTTTLLVLRENGDVPPALFVSDGDLLLLDPPGHDFFLTDHPIDTFQEWQAFLPTRKEMHLDHPSALNRGIRPGESVTLFLGITANVYEGLQRTADTVLVALEAEFTDGSEVPVRLSIPLPPARKGH